MKHSENIDELIIAVLTGRGGAEEKIFLKEWRAAAKANDDQFRCLEKIWKERSSEPRFLNAEELADKIWKKGVEQNIAHYKVHRKKNFNGSYLFKIAAVFAIFLLASYLVYVFRGSTTHKPAVTEVNTVIHKSNPAGQKTRINLPDGSVVWLNSSSSISYPAYFSDNARMIRLKGEAYFEVKKDSLRPFVVQSGNIITTALGTSFNISAYPGHNNIHVALISGTVSVKDEVSEKSIILQPNQGAIYSKNDKEIIEVVINPTDVLAWKDGILRFDGEDFETFVKKLEQWYGVNIKIEGEAPRDWRIRGSFADEYLTNILNSISFNKDFSYTINRKEVVLKFK